jgi:hypothetical protein
MQAILYRHMSVPLGDVLLGDGVAGAGSEGPPAVNAWGSVSPAVTVDAPGRTQLKAAIIT